MTEVAVAAVLLFVSVCSLLAMVICESAETPVVFELCSKDLL